MTFDNIPFVITIKKNEHYFPTMEFTKDTSEPCGWRRQTYSEGTPHNGIESVHEQMDEGQDEGPGEGDISPGPTAQS
jgi:pro-apoptotic serine protease NMA111